ncbi:MAG: DUF1295 domain-containing protein [Candidatus Aminicenantes bacterium]|nr:DUF1295 domain-containing protein [Candidatus Aminicenantes bacterium]
MCVYIALFAAVNLLFYWKQLKGSLLSRRFKKRAFAVWLFFDILLIVVTAVLLLVFIFSTPQPSMFREALVLGIAGGILLIAGLLLSVFAARQVGLLRSFSRSIFTRVRYAEQKSGVFRHCRHPMYLGWFLIFLGTVFIANPSYLLVFSLAGGVYFFIRSKMEGRELEILTRKAAEPGT